MTTLCPNGLFTCLLAGFPTILLRIWSLPPFQDGCPLTSTLHPRGVVLWHFSAWADPSPTNYPSPASFHVVLGVFMVTGTQEWPRAQQGPFSYYTPKLDQRPQSCNKQGGVGHHVALSNHTFASFFYTRPLGVGAV